eukprot:TRINITY_DN1354_c0_g1_i3.p2 TRINITY_DN1354_c0_g1~~TRINITY_DN1354_c0_g1_i3.p2  ORF type:complete len:274 (+),score=79.84 TRINITY_DN1354_c0_g1_i3:1273-2094(+)
MSDEKVSLLHGSSHDETELEEFLLVDNAALAIKVSQLPTDLPDLETALKDFFSFCGAITHFTLKDNEATIVFQTPDAAKSAILLTGATLGNQKINVEAVPNPTPSQPSRVEHVPVEPRTQTSIVDGLLAKGYQLAESAKQQAADYDARYHISDAAQAIIHQVEEKTKEIEATYNLSDAAQATMDSFGKKIQQVDEEYHIGASLNQVVAAAVNTTELARDVIAARTQETSQAIHASTEGLRSQGESLTITALNSAADGIVRIITTLNNFSHWIP